MQTPSTSEAEYFKADLTPPVFTPVALMSLNMLSSSKGQLLVSGVSWYPHRLPWFQRGASHKDPFTQVFRVMRDPVESERVSLFHVVLNRSREGHIAAGLRHQHCPRTWERSASTCGASGQFPLCQMRQIPSLIICLSTGVG